MEIKKQILDIFQDTILSQFKSYCMKHQVEFSTQQLMVYLIDRDFINPSSIRRYVINAEFENLLPKYAYHKTQTVQNLSDKLNITDRTIWSALKYNDDKGKKKMPEMKPAASPSR